MQKINDTIGIVLDFLKEVPLSINTVNDYKIRFQSIQFYCEKNSIIAFSHKEAQAFTEIQKGRRDNGEISDRHFRRLRRSAFLLADCVQSGDFVWKSAIFTQKTLGESYANVLIEYQVYLSSMIAQSTIGVVMSMTRKFLFFLEDNKMYDLKQLTADYVKHFLQEMVEKRPNSMPDLIWAVRKFLSFLNDNNISTINANKYLLRSAPAKKKVLPCFTIQETDAILSVVDTTTVLGKRDYAILKLAIETGLRGADIFQMKLTDINWHKCEISIIQSKTDEAIHLPLLPDVGNAIADYILHARPKSGSPHIFLRIVKPHVWLGNFGSGNNIIRRYLTKAGISHKAWDGKTFHAFRRTQGTRLVEAEVSLPDVAQLLGHRNIDSAKRYISYNDDKLRVCCMDTSEYATRKDGLA